MILTMSESSEAQQNTTAIRPEDEPCKNQMPYSRLGYRAAWKIRNARYARDQDRLTKGAHPNIERVVSEAVESKHQNRRRK